jgi:hypothetical protein
LAGALAALTVVAGYCYAGARWRTLLVWWPLFVAGNTWLAAQLLLPGSPWWFAAVAGGFGLTPGVILAVIVADLRFGLFPLDTFYGLIAVIVLTPAYLGVNLVLLCLP